MENNNGYPGKQWQPIFDHMVDEYDVSLTLSEMEELINVVSKTIGHDALKAKCERYEVALNDIAKQSKIDEMDANEVDGDISEGYDAIINVARKALSAGEGEKEEPEPVNWNDYLLNQKEDQQ